MRKTAEHEKPCEVCGSPSQVKSRINPEGYYKSKKLGGYIAYEEHSYCYLCAENLIITVMNRVQNIW